MIKLKRVYESPSQSDGKRILVERLWPRGLTKEEAEVDEWRKDVAASAELRKWYAHDVEKWPEFEKRYRQELEGYRAKIADLRDLGRRSTVTFVYAARDEEHNSAVVLKEFIEGDGK